MNSRLASENDIDLTFAWATDALVRANSYSSNTITLEGHHEWFIRKLEDDEALFLIMEVDATAVGLVRFERNDTHFVIGITVAPDQRGKGYATKMLIEGLREYALKWSMPVYAYIKTENVASVKAFQRAGFEFEKDLTYLGSPSKLFIWK